MHVNRCSSQKSKLCSTEFLLEYPAKIRKLLLPLGNLFSLSSMVPGFRWDTWTPSYRLQCHLLWVQMCQGDQVPTNGVTPSRTAKGRNDLPALGASISRALKLSMDKSISFDCADRAVLWAGQNKVGSTWPHGPEPPSTWNALPRSACCRSPLWRWFLH